MTFLFIFFNPQGKVFLVRMGKCWCSSHTDREEFALEESAMMSTEQNSALKPSTLPEILDLQQFFFLTEEKKRQERKREGILIWLAGVEESSCLPHVFKSRELILKFQGNKCNITE